MAGFFKVALVCEHFSNEVVNVLHYRSESWLPGQGNPFDDVQNTVNAVVTHVKPAYLSCLDGNTTFRYASAIGLDDQYRIVTSSPLVKTVNENGTRGNKDSTGSFISANISLRCGQQHQIKGSGASKRNRGYLSIGPVTEDAVDSYGHLVDAYVNEGLTSFAQAVCSNIVMLAPAVTLIPIRIHSRPGEAFPSTNPFGFITYSDVLGYTLPRRASVRRSRMGEA
jgi:hypothetical protein